MTLTFEEVGTILDDIAESLPAAFFKELNGGIILLEEIKLHPESREGNLLYVVGEYRHEYRGLGRYIVIYYGSFVRSYGMFSALRQQEELRRVLLHEFTHHIQSLGGTRGLEKEDERRLARFRVRMRPKVNDQK